MEIYLLIYFWKWSCSPPPKMQQRTEHLPTGIRSAQSDGSRGTVSLSDADYPKLQIYYDWELN